MDLEIKNCNNIDKANVSIVDCKLNIKFAPNGTGKSTIARAISLALDPKAGLGELLPFKLRESNPSDLEPELTGLSDDQSVMCFNEDYVRQFVFQQDELLSNSFEILIKTESYREKEQEIEELVSEIKNLFVDNADLENLIDTLKELGGAFKLTRNGLSRSSTGMKGLTGGNKITHIPAGLESYKPFIQSDNSVGWVDWQTKGYDFAELSSNCPFCTSDATDKKEKIKKVGQEYDKNVIKNLLSIIKVIDRLGEYFAPEAHAKLIKITTLKDGLESEHENYLVTVKGQIDDMVGKLERLRNLSGFQFKEDELVSDKLPQYKLDLEFLSELNSEKMQESIEPINSSIEVIIEKAGQLQGKINQQRVEIQRVVQKYQEEINGFLSYAGYDYKVEIAGEGEQSQLKLLHRDHAEHLAGGGQYLSFGERNAFAIVLFMYECLSKKPDLIILDDPISSFDKNKKYAILEMLFRRERDSCLKGKTVLMLTHDVEPIIDTVKALSHKFANQTSAAFLKLSEGRIEEIAIGRDDILTFAEICKVVLDSDKDEIIKLIYLRRHREIIDDKGDVYQVLSNLLHKRSTPLDTREPMDDNDQFPNMATDKFDAGCAEIVTVLPDFSYPAAVARIQNAQELKNIYDNCGNGYEKLQICRLVDHPEDDPVVEKFIKQTFHIENEFICQLDPSRYDTIPEYVVKKCDQIVSVLDG